MSGLNVSIKLDAYLNKLIHEIDTHLVSTQHILRSLEDGTYFAKADRTRPGSVVRMELNNLKDPVTVSKGELNQCFKELVSTFLDFIDQLIGVSIVMSNQNMQISRDLHGIEEIKGYINEYIQSEIQKVARDQSLRSNTKIDMLPGLSPSSKKTAKDYVALRNSLEHQKGIANRDINLRWRAVRIYIGDEAINELPIIAEKDSVISLSIPIESRLIAKGDEIEISEEELEGIAFNIKNMLAPEATKSDSKEKEG